MSKDSLSAVFEIRFPLCAGELASATDYCLGGSRVGDRFLRTECLPASPGADFLTGRVVSALPQDDDPPAHSAQSNVGFGLLGYPSSWFAWDTNADFLFRYDHRGLVHGPASGAHH